MNEGDFCHFFAWQFLPEKPLLMSKSDPKRKSAMIEDEKAFTDLLFGDVKEEEEPVCCSLHHSFVDGYQGGNSRKERASRTLARFGRRGGARECETRSTQSKVSRE